MSDREAADLMRAAWKAADTRAIKKGWPSGAPPVPRALRDHASHYRTPTGLVYRAEPYGPLTATEIGALHALFDDWVVSVDPMLSTHFPGSTVQVLYRKRR